MEQQKQVIVEINTLLELLEHAPETDAVMVMQAMDRLQQLLATPSAGCEDQTAFAKKGRYHEFH